VRGSVRSDRFCVDLLSKTVLILFFFVNLSKYHILENEHNEKCYCVFTSDSLVVVVYMHVCIYVVVYRKEGRNVVAFQAFNCALACI
jgi:hypothetical protein